MITIQNLHKRFDGLEVLTGVDLEIETGQSVVIIGRSGCGKSVLLKHIVALLRPDRGNVMVNGDSVFDYKEKELREYRKRVGVLFQFGALFDSMTVAENVGFCLKESMNMSLVLIEERVAEMLALVGLADIGEKMPAEISGGMKKRVALARAIAAEPNILLYDEPTTGLDPINADRINELIVNVNKKLGVTSIAVTHDMASAYKIADRIVMLYQGKVICDGTPDQIRTSDDAVVRQFINGSSTGPITAH
ncbi:MAG: ABC transporter ATP-binding protein [FCB group bacterium]|nr:ABC transporter ATP-binding protein [FCB group bacterium]